MEPVPATPVASATVVEPLPTLRWGAILAGWAVSIGIATVLYLGGAALGLASFHAHDPQSSAKALGLGTAVWVVLTWVASSFVGGMFASWFDGRDDQMMGTMHGVSVWGVSILATVLLLASGPLHHRSQGADMHGPAMMADDSALGMDAALLRAQLRAQLRNAGGTAQPSPSASDGASSVVSDAIPPATPRESSHEEEVDAVAVALVTTQSSQAQALLVADGLTEADASRVAQTVERQAAKAREDAKEAADRAAKHAAMVAGLLFLSALLSMLAAALGGWLGAHHIHHVYHLRVYKRSP